MQSKNFTRTVPFAAICVTALLSACGGGGGGGGGGDNDTKPDAFGFAGFDNVLPGFAYTSDEIKVKGVSDGADLALTVTGDGCEYSIDGGDFGNGETRVSKGQEVTLRLTTPNTYETEQACTLDINGISADFTLKTGKNTFAMEAVPGHLAFSWSEFTGAESYRIQRTNHETGETEIVAEDIAGGADSHRLPVSVHLADWINDRYQLIACSGECNSLPGHEAETVQAMSVAAIEYLKASNTEEEDFFGFSIAVSGDLMVIGAPEEDSNADGVNGDQQNADAPNSGAAYVFRRGENGAWAQEAYLKATPPETQARFGKSVAIDDDRIAVGAPEDDNHGEFWNSGAVYVFHRDQHEWAPETRLVASNIRNDAYFGHSLALQDDTLAVGSPGERSDARGVDGDQGDIDAPDSGAVYMFRNGADGWTQEAYIKASNTDTGDRFGSSIALDDETLVAGAPDEDSNGVDGQDDNSADNSGAAYVLVRGDDGKWAHEAYLKASNAALNDRFASSVALHGGLLAVGAPDEDGNGVDGEDNDDADYSGAAYVFNRDDNGDWTQEAYLKAAVVDAHDGFGISLALHDDTLAVGASYESGNGAGVNPDADNNEEFGSGAVYVFKRGSDGQWTQKSYIKASNPEGASYPEDPDLFGSHVALSRDTLVVGAYGEDSNATGVNGDQENNEALESGAVYVY